MRVMPLMGFWLTFACGVMGAVGCFELYKGETILGVETLAGIALLMWMIRPKRVP